MGGNNGLKFIAVAVLLEYVFIKPRIMLGGDGTDFVGIVLVHAVLAYIGRLNTQYLTDKQRSAALANGLLGGAFGYAWLLFHIKFHERQVQHLFVANALILAGIILRAWYDRRLNARDGRQV
ncbi:hypothetical protein CLAFUW4_04685 [Fulvia fulva]|uniref:Uncharacterized protein n=1 Tax=Passalora fulva TaxID=5499 RepID=A0A9Q8LFE6_PASFU|nr:uncharacterized protein CLAFUR5_04646 [Fulvia fulva]KAK4627354.1 hypothetical protein CLAFUR4_04671 [Fulvia fulva]KAK4628014.1 hypothetical protein CLAFUR0_04675 [Fulvia fulva]UJO16447.1 hypothetical protein CLAFUR5_04646 [Fulvia fulva]WPV13646.1 hypothetical protein CLAFUW4_04685 [Fulvia fulva]WPV29350.1 hypothetical protein CLAFUW7_04679 [Fulvia fulva]